MIFRNNARVPEENEYLFGRCDPNGMIMDATFSANASLTKFRANVPGAKNITATKLRKHLATISNELKLDDRGINNITEFMGHDTSIHKNIYRQIPVGRYVVDVAPVLNTAIGVTGHGAHLFEDSMGTEKYSDPNSTTTYEEVSMSNIEGPTNSEKNVPYKE
ncbi:hypothetical protein JTB14_016360 [Gonioctena quinquepunctata]|nr:hypothetical protein JTB14_016360 [Gonioctena quinquepunctata]